MRWACALALTVVGGLVGCESAPRVDGPRPELPTYAELRDHYNARADRLMRIWARATISIEFEDENGRSRYEQGDGHFQLIQPSQLALSIGKLGEVFLWIGCDQDQYWLLEPRESRRGLFGRHDRLTPRKTQAMGLPVAPRDLIQLLGVTPLPELPPSGASLVWNDDGDRMVLDLPAQAGIWRHVLDPQSMHPERIELYPPDADSPLLSARLTSYEPVAIRGEGGFFPRMASRIWLTHHEEDAIMRLSIEGMVDGGRQRLSPEVFELSSLVEALGISGLRNLDAPPPPISAPNANQ